MKITVACQECGSIRDIVPRRSESSESYIKRRPLCVACGHKKRIKTLGGHAPNWKGGARCIDAKGYVIIWNDVEKEYVKEHRKIWEDQYGQIPKGYVIHHKDEDKQNNDIRNLDCMTKKEHDKHHGDHLRRNHYNQTTKRTEDLTCVA